MSAASAKRRNDDPSRSAELDAAFDEFLTYLAQEIAREYVARVSTTETTTAPTGEQP